jgi:hypothetical protein
MSCSARTSYILVFAVLQTLFYSNVLSFLTSKDLLTRPNVHSSKRSYPQSISILQSTVESTEKLFENSWAEHNIIAKSVKHTFFSYSSLGEDLRGLQATTGQSKKGDTVISVPKSETISSTDSGLQGCPPGNNV